MNAVDGRVNESKGETEKNTKLTKKKIERNYKIGVDLFSFHFCWVFPSSCSAQHSIKWNTFLIYYVKSCNHNREILQLLFSSLYSIIGSCDCFLFGWHSLVVCLLCSVYFTNAFVTIDPSAQSNVVTPHVRFNCNALTCYRLIQNQLCWQSRCVNWKPIDWIRAAQVANGIKQTNCSLVSYALRIIHVLNWWECKQRNPFIRNGVCAALTPRHF